MGMARCSGVKVLASKTDVVDGENHCPQVVPDLHLKGRTEGCHTLSHTRKVNIFFKREVRLGHH